MQPCENGEVKLLTAVLVQAVKDTLTGDEEARQFLVDVGADLAEVLHIAEARHVRRWAKSPTQPKTVTVEEAARVIRCNAQTVYKYVRNGELPAYPSIFDKSTWCILPEDLVAWSWRYDDEHRLV